jgi:DNA invertase Pin-like site-specific DNA recombinase
VENQIRELKEVAERRGWEVVQVYGDAGISGSKGRANRLGLDQMLKDASRREFDIVMAWAIDRVGRSLIDLLHTIQHLEACGADLYLDQQGAEPIGNTPQEFAAFMKVELARWATTVKAAGISLE